MTSLHQRHGGEKLRPVMLKTGHSSTAVRQYKTLSDEKFMSASDAVACKVLKGTSANSIDDGASSCTSSVAR